MSKSKGFEVNATGVLIVAGLVGVVGFAVYAWRRGGVQPAAQGIGQGVGQAIGGAVVGAGTGLVIGAGQAVGIPATNETECDRARREGRTWDASFACPAGDFVGYLFGRGVQPGPAVNQAIMDPRDALAIVGQKREPGEVNAPQLMPPPYWDGAMVDGSQTWWGAP